jgi:hypothetical protein
MEAQSYIELPSLREVQSQILNKALDEKLHFEYDAVEVNAKAGDQMAIWNNSGIIKCWHKFEKDQAVILPLGYYIGGIYHLGYRNSNGRKNVITFRLTYNGEGG